MKDEPRDHTSTYRFSGESERLAGLALARRLRDGDHAINVAETFDSEGKFEHVVITHYQTCAVCREEKLNGQVHEPPR